MAFSLPVYGKSGFVINEDVFDVSVDKTVDAIAGVGQTFGLSDSFGLRDASPCEIIIYCEGKKKMIRSLISAPIKLSGKAEWKEFMSGGISALGGSLISAGNQALQFTLGEGIQQPWMNRKTWVSTKPFSFSIPMKFVAESDAYSEVYEPCLGLMSLVYPRETGVTGAAALNEINQNTGVDLTQKTKSGGDNMIAAAASAVSLYYIPGPSVKYGAGDDSQNGDNVSIMIGNVASFEACYIENVDIEFSNVMSSNGFPISANVTLQVSVMDSSVVKEDGEFTFSQFKSDLYNFSNALNSCTEGVKDVATALVEHVKALGGFYGIGAGGTSA